MKFKYKVFNPDSNGVIDKSKFTFDEMSANNEDEFRQAVTMIGQQVEVIERVGQPAPSNLAGVPSQSPMAPSEAMPGQIPMPQGIAPYYPGGGVVPTPMAPPRPPVVEFEDNGVKFKVEGGSVFKKDWIDVKPEEYRIVEKTTGKATDLTILKDLKVQKIDWVKVK